MGRDEVRRPRALSQQGTRAAAELPAGPLGVPARSWLTARSAHRCATDRTKAGPVAGDVRDWRAARRPRAARHEPQDFALFGAPSPLKSRTRTRRGKEPARLVQARQKTPSYRRKPVSRVACSEPMAPGSGFRRDDEAGFFPAALAPDRASHYFPDTKRSSMQRLTGQKRIGAGAISRIPAASARALLDLKRLVLRRP